jgi:hypothetical protein
VEDLEEDAKPEDLMLSYVSGDKSKVSGQAPAAAGGFWGFGVVFKQQHQYYY